MKPALLFSVVLFLVVSGCGRNHHGLPGAPGAKGDQGEKGEAGTPAILEVIDPCGDAANIVDEVLIRMSNGQVLVSFSDDSSGNNTRLSVLPPGSYTTTDGSACQFTIDSSGHVLD